MLGMGVAFGAKVWFEDRGQGWALPWWDWPFIAIGAVLCVLGLILVITPPSLILNDEGLNWRFFTGRRWIAWRDVERVGVAIRDTSGDLASRFGTSMATDMLNAPHIGIDFKPGRNPIKDSGKAAYYRGLFGYDLAWPADFEHGTSWIIERMQERLDAYRAEPASVTAPPHSP